VADWNVVNDEFVRFQPVVECRERLESVKAIWLVIDELESGVESIRSRCTLTIFPIIGLITFPSGSRTGGMNETVNYI